MPLSYPLHVVFRPWGNRIEWEEERQGGALTCEQSVDIEYFLAVLLIFRIYRRHWRWFPWGWGVRRWNVRLSGKRVTRKRRRYFLRTLGKEHGRNWWWRGWGRAKDKSRLVCMRKVLQGLIRARIMPLETSWNSKEITLTVLRAGRRQWLKINLKLRKMICGIVLI